MKNARLILLVLCMSACTWLMAQNNVGINTTTPHASSSLTIDTAASGPQGVLIPRMTQARRNAIASPATGLLIYQTDNTPGFYYYDGTVWSTMGGGGGAKLEAVFKKTAATQALPLSTASADVLIYDNIVTAPTTGSYNTSTNAYTVGAAGVYLIQTRNTVVPVSPTNNQVGAYNWLEVNGAALGSYNNFYPTYVSNGSQGGVTPAAIKSSTAYTFFVFLNAGDVIKIRATGLNSGVAQTLNNDGGTQMMIFKL